MVWSTFKLQQLTLLVISSEVTELWDEHRTIIEYNLPFGVQVQVLQQITVASFKSLVPRIFS